MNAEDLKLKFIRKWTSLLNEEEVVTDLDELLEAKSKEVAEKAWNDCEEDVANHYLDSKDCLYESFDDWYSNYLKQK